MIDVFRCSSPLVKSRVARMLILILSLLGGYIGLATLITTLSVLLDKWYSKERKQWLALHLKEGVRQNPETWLRTINQTFLDSFDRLFSTSESLVEQGIWAGLLLSPLMLAGIQIPSLIGIEDSLFEDAFEDTSDLLLLAMLLAFMTSFSAIIGRSLAVRSDLLNLIIYSINIMVMIGGITIIVPLVTIVTIKVILTLVIIGFVMGLFFATSRADISIGSFYIRLIVASIGMVIGRITASALTSYIASSIVQGIIMGIIMMTVPLAVIVAVTYTRPVHQFLQQGIHISVHPLKALGSSLAFIVVVSLIASFIRTDAVSSFLDTINREGVKILAFVAFNMFADGISLLETRWVLQRGINATVIQLLGLLAVDLLASAAIFLILPTILGELTTFWSSVLLQGDRPWLGILFWSTFGTSVIFYLFVIASLLAHPLIPLHRGIGFISQGFKLEEYPFGFIALSLFLILTLIFTIGGLVALTAS